MKFIIILFNICLKLLISNGCLGGGGGSKSSSYSTNLYANRPAPSVIESFDQSGCGLEPNTGRNFLDKIINGQTAGLNQWPWIVSIRIKTGSNIYKHTCGGSIISSQYIVTAAHCISTKIDDYLIIPGINNLDDQYTNSYEVYRAIIHSQYYTDLYGGYDIAVLQLMRPITYTTNIYSICIPSLSDSSSLFGKLATTIGWGSTTGENNQESLSNSLQQIQLEVKSNCLEASYFCALEKTSIPDSNICFGDSGGPLMFKNTDNKWYVYGLSSFVLVKPNKNCDPSQPSYYTKVAENINSILNRI